MDKAGAAPNEPFAFVRTFLPAEDEAYATASSIMRCKRLAEKGWKSNHPAHTRHARPVLKSRAVCNSSRLRPTRIGSA